MMKLISWNVNGLRSTEKEFLAFMQKEQPDICMLQELRAHPDQLSLFLKTIPDYKAAYNPSQKAGYSGTAFYHKKDLNIDSVSSDLPNVIISKEGRIQQARIGKMIILNVYTPNGTSGEERLKFKLHYYDELLKYCNFLFENGYSVILGGDLNVAHTKKDLFNPKANKNHSGFLSIERKWFDKILKIDFIDSFRMFTKEGGHYTWWHFGDPKRKKNKGWRFDYFLVSKDLKSKVKSAKILKNVFGSDHCPIQLTVVG
jgi:exodeoxyribonuclease-3